MATSALLSSVVMGGLLLVIIALALRVRRWQHPAPSTPSAPSAVVERINGPLGWSIGFFVVTFGVMGLVILYVAGAPVAGLDQSTIGLLVLLAVGLAFVLGVLVSVYGAVRSRGLNSAQAAAVGAALLGTFLLLAIVFQLVGGGVGAGTAG